MITINADIAKTTVNWKGSHLGGIAPHNGTVMLKNGSVIVEENNIIGGKFTVDLATVQNNDLAEDPDTQKKLLGHIASPDILNVAKFPEAVFEITSVKPAEGEFNASVTGNLTFLGAKNGSFRFLDRLVRPSNYCYAYTRSSQCSHSRKPRQSKLGK